MNICFRADATEKIGIGHIMRCLALAEELKKNDHTVFFYSDIDSEYISNKINKQGYALYKTKKNKAKDMIGFADEHSIDWVITDHYDTTTEYIKNLKENDLKVLSIDDNAVIFYESDIVLNQNIGADKLNYRTNENTHLLLGSKFAMLRDELLKRQDAEKEKVENVLITLGGTDKENLTEKILKTLYCKQPELNYIILVGPLNPHINKLQDFASNKKNIILEKTPEKMSEIYQKTDIAICAGGSTCYELAYYGIPNIIISIAGNQINSSKEFDTQKISIYLGSKVNYTNQQLIISFNQLIHDQKLRKNMSKNAKKLVDGLGKKRIVETLERFS